MIRLTLTDSGDITVHGRLGERPLMPDEIELLREAIEAPRLPAWIEWGTVCAVIGAMAFWVHGIGRGVGS